MHVPRPPRRPTTPRAMLLGALLPLAACDSSTAPREPAAATHDLLFVARVHGFDELFTVPLAGGTPQPMFAGEVNAHHPAPSPNGRQVAFFDLADDELWIGERGATRVRNVSQFADEIDVMPAWSPDGTRIAFATDRAGYRAIWTMRPDGTDLVQVTADPNARDYEPSWSPDGRRLVVRRVRTESGGARTDLAIVNVADGSVVEFRRPGTERYPSWSPDGAWIAYASDAVGAEFRIFTVRPDGSENVERAGGTAFGRHALYPRWIRRP